MWLARTYPRGKLLPADAAEAQKVIDLMEFALIQLHGEGFTRVFVADRYVAQESQQGGRLKDDVTAHGREIVSQAFEVLEKKMPETGYVAGPDFTIADAALFYNEFWADRTGIKLPPRVEAHYRRVRARPVVRQVLAEEGYRT
ncbi:glutathione S-transferase family protein [Xanthobacter sp. KR7-65]|uniref:glutathione S-transferase family protein n=1 Tax=Xanthobacter sp. KR7-65 TaxID=3156612 RepID=UPI0032B31DE8